MKIERKVSFYAGIRTEPGTSVSVAEHATSTPPPRPMFLIVNNQDHIIIASDTDDDGGHNGRTQIPAGMVRKLKVLRKATTKKEPQATNDDHHL